MLGFWVAYFQMIQCKIDIPIWVKCFWCQSKWIRLPAICSGTLFFFFIISVEWRVPFPITTCGLFRSIWKKTFYRFIFIANFYRFREITLGEQSNIDFCQRLTGHFAPYYFFFNIGWKFYTWATEPSFFDYKFNIDTQNTHIRLARLQTTEQKKLGSRRQKDLNEQKYQFFL